MKLLATGLLSPETHPKAVLVGGDRWSVRRHGHAEMFFFPRDAPYAL